MFALAKDSSLETLEGNHDNSDIIQGLSVQRILEDTFHSQSTLLMHILSLSLLITLDIHLTTIPHTSIHILVVHLIKDPITSQDNEVMLLSNLKDFDLWISNHNFRIP